VKKAVVVLLILAALLAVTGCGTGMMKIKSPVGDLKYPSKWNKYLRTESGENTVEFYAELKEKDSRHLFTLCFDTGEGYSLGKVDGKEISIVDFEQTFDESWSEEETDIVTGMTSDVNTILDALGLLSLSNENSDIDPVKLSYIDTPIGKLACRKELSDKISVVSESGVLLFEGKTQNNKAVTLFRFGFDRELEYFVGTVGSAKIYCEIDELESSELSEDELKYMCNLQSMVNDLLQSISECEGYEAAFD